MAFWDRFKPSRRGRPPTQPKRDTLAWPNLTGLGQPGIQAKRAVYKPTPKNLRYFSRTPMARRAINTIKNPIAMLDWEIVPIADVDENSEIKRQIALVKACLQAPNNDDNFQTFREQIIEDIMCGAGAVEIGRSPDPLRPVWLWPVDGLSIQIYPGWAGGKSEARYLQTIGYGSYSSVGLGDGISLRNDELIYIRPNPTTATPFGFGPLEIAFNSISRLLATGDFAGKVAGNSLPPFMLDLGEVTSDTVRTWRKYWTDEVEGEGKIPIIATELTSPDSANKARGATVTRLYPEGDKALYIQYQEFLRSEIAAAFDISNMNLNVERDVNRSCYSEDTETLTVDGWKKLHELSATSLVAVYNPQTRAIEYREPALFHVAPYKGDMIHISGRMTDTLVTPDHRMWVRPLRAGEATKKPDHTGFEIVPAARLETMGRFATVATFGNDPTLIAPEMYTIPGCTLGGGVRREYPDRQVAMDDWLAFVGFWLAEGHAKNHSGRWKVNIAQNPGKVADWVDDILSRMPFAFAPNDDATCRRWQVADKALCQHLLAECGEGSHTKRLPKWILFLPTDKMKIVFDAMMSGDGTRDSRLDRNSGIYYTASPQLRDDVQLLATFLGHRATVTLEPTGGVYRVLITDNCQENEIKQVRNVKRVAYDGKVYCFSVPPHCLFVTRRNGKMAIHGNTAEVNEDRDWAGAIKPCASLVKAHIDRDVIQGAFGFSQIELKWVGLDREDEESTAKILTQYFDRSIFTVDDVRAKLGEPPSDTVWGEMTHADIEIAKNAARSAGLIEDPSLPKQTTPTPAASPKPSAPSQAPASRTRKT